MKITVLGTAVVGVGLEAAVLGDTDVGVEVPGGTFAGGCVTTVVGTASRDGWLMDLKGAVR